MLDEVLEEAGGVVLLDYLEILFERTFEMDPLRFLKGLSRYPTVVAAWNGTIEDGSLVSGAIWASVGLGGIFAPAPGGAPMPDATYEGWGPEARRAAVSITFDNLGEAAELELGIWPEDKPVGKHPSATQVVPRVLNLLREYRVRATFFVEGWNMEIYPDLLRSILDAGHDLSYHGWRHENWGKLTQEEETALLDKGIEVAKELGMKPRGFRPPGGALTPSSLQLLAERGFAFCSPGGKAVTLSNAVVILPFEWKAIDAYYYFDQLAPLRESYGDPAHTLGPRRFERAITERLSALVESRQYLALIFHPFLEDDDDRFDTMHRIIDRVVRDESIWCAPCSEVAEWVMGAKGRFEGDPVLDHATWR